MPYQQFASPLVLIASGGIVIIPDYYSWATFNNSGVGAGTIDFGNGQIVPIASGETISMPFVGRPYQATTVDGTLTIIKVVYIR